MKDMTVDSTCVKAIGAAMDYDGGSGAVAIAAGNAIGLERARGVKLDAIVARVQADGWTRASKSTLSIYCVCAVIAALCAKKGLGVDGLGQSQLNLLARAKKRNPKSKLATILDDARKMTVADFQDRWLPSLASEDEEEEAEATEEKVAVAGPITLETILSHIDLLAEQTAENYGTWLEIVAKISAALEVNSKAIAETCDAVDAAVA